MSYDVTQAFVGFSDYGSAIDGMLVTAYNPFDDTQSNKLVHLVRATVQTTAAVDLLLGISADYQTLENVNFNEFQLVVPPTPGAGVWDQSLWDQANWGEVTFAPLQWVTAPATTGFALAIALGTQLNNASVQIASFDVLYEVATGIL